VQQPTSPVTAAHALFAWQQVIETSGDPVEATDAARRQLRVTHTSEPSASSPARRRAKSLIAAVHTVPQFHTHPVQALTASPSATHGRLSSLLDSLTDAAGALPATLAVLGTDATVAAVADAVCNRPGPRPALLVAPLPPPPADAPIGCSGATTLLAEALAASDPVLRCALLRPVALAGLTSFPTITRLEPEAELQLQSVASERGRFLYDRVPTPPSCNAPLSPASLAVSVALRACAAHATSLRHVRLGAAVCTLLGGTSVSVPFVGAVDVDFPHLEPGSAPSGLTVAAAGPSGAHVGTTLSSVGTVRLSLLPFPSPVADMPAPAAPYPAAGLLGVAASSVTPPHRIPACPTSLQLRSGCPAPAAMQLTVRERDESAFSSSLVTSASLAAFIRSDTFHVRIDGVLYGPCLSVEVSLGDEFTVRTFS
jgi:hypothetical protein